MDEVKVGKISGIPIEQQIKTNKPPVKGILPPEPDQSKLLDPRLEEESSKALRDLGAGQTNKKSSSFS